MLAFIVLLLAAFSRFLPFLLGHGVHVAGLNLTAVGAGLLFFGANRPRWQAAIAAAVMALTDVILTTQCYHMAFHVRGYLITWAWYAAVCLIGSGLLRKVTVLRVAAGVVAEATGFFLLSNFVVWMGGLYAHNFAGLVKCYTLALPFYGNDLASTGFFAAVLFGLPVLAARLVESARHTQASGQPLT